MTTKPVMSIIAAKAALDAVNTLLNAGGAGSLIIRSSTQEATTLTGDAGSAVATLGLSATACPGSTSGTSDGLATGTFNAISSDTNAAGGTAGHFRMKSGGGTVILQGNVGTSGADLNLNTVTITAGDTVACTSFKDTLPCGDGVT